MVALRDTPHIRICQSKESIDACVILYISSQRFGIKLTKTKKKPIKSQKKEEEMAIQVTFNCKRFLCFVVVTSILALAEPIEDKFVKDQDPNCLWWFVGKNQAFFGTLTFFGI